MKKKRVLISGSEGQLVTDVIKELYVNNFEVHPFSRREWDVTDDVKTQHLFNTIEPDYYIQGASIHNVEKIEADPAYALDVNIGSLHRMSKLCNQYKTFLINFSTDYVFQEDDLQNIKEKNVIDNKPNREGVYYFYKSVKNPSGHTVKSIPNPANFYGITKYAGELAVSNTAKRYLNVRVAGLFGHRGCQQKDGMNFPLLVLKHLDQNKEMKVVTDQLMTIGYTVDIAKALATSILRLSELGSGYRKCHVLHLINEGILSWYDLAIFIGVLLGKQHLIKPTTTCEMYKDSDIKRPSFSALHNDSSTQLPPWQQAVVRYLREIGRL